VAIVDAYDALTHDRVYRFALPEDKAVEIMENGLGAQFDPCLLRLFLALLPEIRRIGQATPDDPTLAAESPSGSRLMPPRGRMVSRRNSAMDVRAFARRNWPVGLAESAANDRLHAAVAALSPDAGAAAAKH